MEKFREILPNFNVYGDLINVKPYGNGHINDTYLVKYRQAGQKVRYILRRINNLVFANPEQIIENSLNVTRHIKKKLFVSGEKDLSRKVLTFIPTKQNNFSFTDGNNDTWSMNFYIKGTHTVEKVESKIHAFEAAKAYAKFQKYLSDFDLSKCSITIKDFHNLPKRLEKYINALKSDGFNRITQAKSAIDKIDDFLFLSESFIELNKFEIKQRITHNDTKINNILLDKKTGEGICVLDLDTVMPGIVLNDFGDMVRSFVCSSPEDDKDISKINVRLNIFEALTKGYLGELNNILTNDEKNNLVLGSKIIVYEQAVRFLTDFLERDPYYKIDYTNHNLIRARNQLALLESIEKHSGQMDEIVKAYS